MLPCNSYDNLTVFLISKGCFKLNQWLLIWHNFMLSTVSLYPYGTLNWLCRSVVQSRRANLQINEWSLHWLPSSDLLGVGKANGDSEGREVGRWVSGMADRHAYMPEESRHWHIRFRFLNLPQTITSYLSISNALNISRSMQLCGQLGTLNWARGLDRRRERCAFSINYSARSNRHSSSSPIRCQNLTWGREDIESKIYADQEHWSFQIQHLMHLFTFRVKYFFSSL